MSDINALFSYRREQALSTLQEAEKMVNGGFTPRTIINRSYYAMFYMVLALFLKKGIGISTSKHTGIIGTFDKQFILTDTLDRTYSKMLHKMFDKRLEFDYKDFMDPSMDEARQGVTTARRFIDALDTLCTNTS